MTDGNAERIFGERVHGASYIRRPSAYAVIWNGAGHVVLVRTAQGVFLPGGGLEIGEAPDEAVLREVREECGLSVRLLSRLPDATQLVYSPSEQTYFEKASSFFTAAIEGDRTCTPGGGHEVLWVVVDAAVALVSHESHRWALRYDASSPSADDAQVRRQH